MREGLLVSVAIAVLVGPGVRAGSSTPFRLGQGGSVVVAAALNGQGPFFMLLDTGATHSAITESAARRIAARPVARSSILTATGPTVRTVVSLETLGLGPVVARNVLPSVVADGAFDRNGDVHGLIGQDVLAQLRYTLDFREHTVEWHDGSPEAVSGTRLSLVLEHGRFLVDLPQRGQRLRLVPDSGAEGFVLFGRSARESLGITEMGETVELATADAKRPARIVRLREFRLGERTLRDVRAVAIDRGELHPAEGDGLLPLHFFERVTFDGPGRLLILG